MTAIRDRIIRAAKADYMHPSEAEAALAAACEALRLAKQKAENEADDIRGYRESIKDTGPSHTAYWAGKLDGVNQALIDIDQLLTEIETGSPQPNGSVDPKSAVIDPRPTCATCVHCWWKADRTRMCAHDSEANPMHWQETTENFGCIHHAS